VLAGMVMVYLFVRRETGQRLPGLLALTLFGVNTHYEEAVTWFSASFGLLALDTLLLGLLAAQRYRQTGRWLHLAICACWVSLAPCWFGTGVLAGPLCVLYLIPAGSGDPRRARDSRRARALVRHCLIALVPLLGTAVSLAITAPRNAEKILNLPRVEKEAKAWETFDPRTALVYTLRACVDGVVPGAAGITGLMLPIPLIVAGWLLLAGLGFWWWRRAPDRRLLLLGVGIIFSSYLLIYTARAYLEYEDMRFWGRYHLFAHLGLVLFISGGWPTQDSEGSPLIWQIDLFAGLVVLLMLTQFPRAYFGRTAYREASGYQLVQLRRIEEVDERCQRYHIEAGTARKALPYFDVYGCNEREINGHRISGWDFLQGSDDPRTISVEEARRLLAEDLPQSRKGAKEEQSFCLSLRLCGFAGGL
jgi:hypothetical protein